MNAVLEEFRATVEAPCEPREISEREAEDGVLGCTALRLRGGRVTRVMNWRNVERLENAVQTLTDAGLDYVAALNFFVFDRRGDVVAPVSRNYF
jgi:hypothetical protein